MFSWKVKFEKSFNWKVLGWKHSLWVGKDRFSSPLDRYLSKKIISFPFSNGIFQFRVDVQFRVEVKIFQFHNFFNNTNAGQSLPSVNFRDHKFRLLKMFFWSKVSLPTVIPSKRGDIWFDPVLLIQTVRNIFLVNPNNDYDNYDFFSKNFHRRYASVTFLRPKYLRFY